MSDDKTWLVYSREHNCWWGPNRCGYTCDIKRAGRYTKAEADDICGNDITHGRRGFLPANDEGPSEFAVQADQDSVATPPPDTSLLLAYAECEDVLSGDKPVAWGVIESTLKRHGYTGTIAVPLMKAWTRDLRRRALAGETK